MSDVRDRAMGADVDPPRPPSDTVVKSYRYLRLALVALLIGLAAGVGYQTWRQGFDLLSSVSAYYYTPAQAILVGALIAMAACMIALKGTTRVEDLFLNLGGMFAAVVAIVPTSRGEDHEAAVRACKEEAGPLLTEKASNDMDCPTVQALADATRANVENNMFALLVVGLLALLATALLALREKDGLDWRGFGAAVVVFAVTAVAFFAFTDWFIGRAHFIAAVGLFLCIVVVVVENVFRHQAEHSGAAGEVPRSVGVLVAPSDNRDGYIWIARLMLPAIAVVLVLWIANVITLFWLEILVAAFFIVFWLTQTIERFGKER